MTIPKHIMDEAEAVYEDSPIKVIGYMEARTMIRHIAQALLAAEQRGREMEREECAKLSANLSPDDVTDDSHTNGWTLGFLRARKCIAAAIRSRTTEG